MRKLSLLLALLMLLICMVSCGGDNSKTSDPTETNSPEQTTEAPDTTDAPTVDSTGELTDETDPPETPQDKWTGRY